MTEIGLEKPANRWRLHPALWTPITPNSHTDYPTEKSEQSRFVKNHSHDASARPTQREQHTNLMGPLENRHEHRVHHAEDTDEQWRGETCPSSLP